MKAGNDMSRTKKMKRNEQGDKRRRGSFLGNSIYRVGLLISYCQRPISRSNVLAKVKCSSSQLTEDCAYLVHGEIYWSLIFLLFWLFYFSTCVFLLVPSGGQKKTRGPVVCRCRLIWLHCHGRTRFLSKSLLLCAAVSKYFVHVYFFSQTRFITLINYLFSSGFHRHFMSINCTGHWKLSSQV